VFVKHNVIETCYTTFWKRATEINHITAKTYVKHACIRKMCIPSISLIMCASVRVCVCGRRGGGGGGGGFLSAHRNFHEVDWIGPIMERKSIFSWIQL
jgi:hypothetical protein